MMTTCLPAASIGGASIRPATNRFEPTRCSIARRTPDSARPGVAARSRPASAPHASSSAWCRDRSSRAVTSTPAAQPVTNSTPSAASCSRRLSMCSFSSLKSGMPYRIRPPSLSSRSYTVTACPARASCCAAARPAGPEPTMPTLRPDQAEREGTVGDLHLDLLDGDRLAAADGQHARRLARGRAEPAGELREVVRRVQRLAGELPGAGADQVVPVRDPISKWAAGSVTSAERDAAVHAPGRLVADELLAG